MISHRRLFPAPGRPDRRGYSLIELVVVMGILALLIGVTLPAIQKVRDAAAGHRCRNNLRTLGLICHQFHDAHGYFPRNTVRPRGVTPVRGEPAGNLSHWNSGTFESWVRQVAPYLDRPKALTQDAIPGLGCPADPRGVTYAVPAYGFTWYVGVYSNPSTVNNGILVDDSKLKKKFTVSIPAVTDGTSHTLLLAERPPPADGQWGWWDSRCCVEDDISPVRGDRSVYSSGRFGKCPDPAVYGPGSVLDNCPFNSVWSLHPRGGNFAMGDGSVRTIPFAAGNQKAGSTTLLEALASRSGAEPVDGE